MNLRYTLPDEELGLIRALLKDSADQDIVYCVPYDLTTDGEFCADGWVVVTKKRLFVLKAGEITARVELADADEVLCISQIDNGQLAVKQDGKDTLLCRFSMRHMVRQSYVARGATAFCRGEDREVVSSEKEKHCPVCGRVLPGTNLCPKCSGRGRGIRRLGDLCRGYAPALVGIMALILIVSVATIGQQFVQRYFVDEVLLPAKGGWKEILAFFAVTAALIALIVAPSIIRNYAINSLGTRISRDLRSRVFEKINALSLSFIDSRQAGELMNRVVEDSGKVRQFLEEVAAGLFTQLFIMLGAVGTMLFMDWKLTLLTVSLMPLAALVIYSFRRYEMRLWRQQWRFNDRVNSRLQDVISGMRVVKSFGQEERETQRFLDDTQRLMRMQRRNEIFWATLYPFVSFIMGTGTYIVIYFGGVNVLEGGMTIGQLTQFIAYAGMLFGPLGFMTRLPRMIMQLTTSLERIYDILEEESDIQEGKAILGEDTTGDVEFQDMSFGYKSYLPVLEHIDLKVKPGEMIGLVGPSGAGKSTMINLLMRLYDADDGRILFSGKDLRDIQQESLHGTIGVVLQETFLFTGTIFDNIRFSKPDATREEVIHAAKMANAHEFIVRFSDGYDTYVGEHGYTLSGGERQRIAIARAILHDPKLLILDEATSSLDTETEYQIQEALGRLTKGRTTFAIAHRLSTLRNADRIVVIDHHHIAEVGSHNELMKRKGIYYGLVMAQLEMHKVRGA